MTSRAVHWHEGMFLRPHHFQASHRHLVDLSRRNHNWDLHYNWGLRSIDLDLEALGNHRLVIHSLEARLRDGTPVVIPGDGPLPERNLHRIFQEKETRSLLVYLAVPALYLGRRNISPERTHDARYYHQSMVFEDENTGGNPQAVPARVLNFQLLVGNEDQTGYEVLPIARLEKTAHAEGGPQLDLSYIPPVLSCDAWKPLAEGILQSLYVRLDQKIDFLAQQMTAEGITFDRQAPGDALVLRQLQQLNEAICVLGILISAPGVHPLWAFLEISRVVGQMAIFEADRHPPDLPRYNHDDLGTCFGNIKQHLDGQMNIVREPEYKTRNFIGAGMRMQVPLEPGWLDPSWQMFIGVKSSLEAMQCVGLLTKAGQLDMKIGSAEHVEEIFRKGLSGLHFVAERTPPQGLPKVIGQVYFQITPEPKNPEWLLVQKSLSLALRLNDNLIVGSIQNQQRLTIKAGGKNINMEFSLYVLPEKK